MLVVVKPGDSQCKQAHIHWLQRQNEVKKLHCYWFYTTPNFNDDLNKLRRLVARHCLLVVIGGDGTIHLAANALVGSSCELAILPAGTGNDFARQFNRTTMQWRESVFSHRKSQIDVGFINQRYFINVMGLGYSAHVVNAVNKSSKRHPLSYIWAALKALFSYQGVFVRVAGSKVNKKVMMLLFANGQYFAAGIKCAPNATLHDGCLQVVSVSPDSHWARVKTFLMMLCAKHEKISCVSVSCGRHFDIVTPDLDIEADGELVGKTPAVIGIRQKALTLRG
ncbi:transcriptional regulator [Pseudoalteromonas sp. A25]|uniref:diacylglycerol/lipid kinase family protein n=1 Tax=Pseudoalteromonas sp. A25 TaxID=116092 RepID=UPI00126067F1|nr:YegS/Rv2252/BmrU family lipid kinase [Pseudoalteromonas sp. A25]BBN80055.1 transcriptional regulator [Pseudoalteromonas sp. A25]